MPAHICMRWLQITLHNIPVELWRRARAPDLDGVDDAAENGLERN